MSGLALDEPLLDITQTAELLGLRPRTIYYLVKRGQLPVIRVGRAIRFDRRALAEHLAAGSSR